MHWFPHSPASVQGTGNHAPRKRAAGKRGEKAGSLDPRGNKGDRQISGWVLSNRQAVRRVRRVRVQWGRLAGYEVVAQRSTGRVFIVDGDRESLSHPCTLQALHRQDHHGLQPRMSETRHHHPLVM